MAWERKFWVQHFVHITEALLRKSIDVFVVITNLLLEAIHEVT